jgi:rod shape-determining protein MreB
MAEAAKIAAGSAYPLDEELGVTLRGRDVITGLPKAVDISSVELREAITQPVSEIVEVVRTALEETPPELVADIMQHGITLAGGGALLKGLDKRLAIETKMPVYIAEDPLTCVVRGAGRIVESLEQYDRILKTSANMRRVVVVTT